MDHHRPLYEELKKAGLPTVACGLNADWSVQAFYIGGNKPNMTDGDLYILHEEEGAGSTYSVVRYFPSEYEKDDYDTDNLIRVLGEGLGPAEAVELVRRSL